MKGGNCVSAVRQIYKPALRCGVIEPKMLAIKLGFCESALFAA